MKPFKPLSCIFAYITIYQLVCGVVSVCAQSQPDHGGIDYGSTYLGNIDNQDNPEDVEIMDISEASGTETDYQQNENYDNSPVTSYANSNLYDGGGGEVETVGTNPSKEIADQEHFVEPNDDLQNENYQDHQYHENLEPSPQPVNFDTGNYHQYTEGPNLSTVLANQYQYAHSHTNPVGSGSNYISRDGFQVPQIPSFYLPFPSPVLHNLENTEEFQHPLKHGQQGLNLWEGLSLIGYGVFGELTKEVSIVVLFFLSFYVIFALFFKDLVPKLLQPKCENWGWDGPPEWEFHAGPRFVPAMPMDPRMQEEFLDLFRAGRRLKGKGSSESSSSEEDSMERYSTTLSHINEMCPRDAFFYGLAPRHLEAYRALQRLFVAQRTPADVLHLAKSILYSGKMNPKVWYLGLLAASIERPDMTGFALAHPIDAMPDLFVAAHLIDDEFEDKWRKDKDLQRNLRHNNYTSLSNYKIGYKKPSNSTYKTYKKPKFMKITNSSTTKAKIYSYKATKDIKKKPVKPRVRRQAQNALGKTIVKSPVFPSTAALNAGRSKSKGDPGPVHSGDKKISYRNANGKKGKKGKGKGKKKRECVVMDGSIGMDNGIENRLWYWREDMMLNQHHLYWHQFYNPNATRHGDRRAELFFFMHREFLARYNAERLSCGLERTYELDLHYGTPLFEGYNSHLADIHSGKFWTPRPPHTKLFDAMHQHDPDFTRNIMIADWTTWMERFLRGIHEGKLLNGNGEFLHIRDKKGGGIHPLGNTIEASDLSVNPYYYDAFGLHNSGHLLIALTVDPNFKKKLPTGIMSDAGVSMRDPSFYPYHTIMDNVFERFKETLPPYKITGGPYPLLWNGVEIIETEIVSLNGGPVNELRTFYSQQRYELSAGVDGSIDKGEEIDVCATHLDHEPFLFKIVIDRKPCARSKSGKATVRIKMAPRFDEHGERLPLVEQRRLMFSLDAFQVDLKIGRNTITRKAEDSALTIPWVKSLSEMEQGPDGTGAADYCGCGWPRHLYIPKGTTHGLGFDLFVMVTNFDGDFVPDDPKDLETPETCNSAYIFCGLPRRRYPDSKPMGYPFDRPAYKVPSGGEHCPPGDVVCKWKHKHRPVATLEEYVAPVPNMATISFGIKHTDKLFFKKPKFS